MGFDQRPNQPRQAARGLQQDNTEQLAAHADLMAELVHAVRNGATVPCLSHRSTWTAPDNATQTAAARACGSCPVLAECGAYVTAFPEPAGVWAGTTERQRTHTRKAAS